MDYSKTRVLVVDDYQTMVRITRNLLRQIGFVEVDSASDGETALKMMCTKSYDLVLADWNMEPTTGYDLLREVCNDVLLAKVPFIMLMAETNLTERLVAARKFALNSYITKPFGAVQLKGKIDAVFEAIEEDRRLKEEALADSQADAPVFVGNPAELRPSKLIELLKPFCRSDVNDEPVVLIAPTPGAIMPVALNAVKDYQVNNTDYVLLFKDPNQK